MKILALIPARGGSKRLPRKNIKLLGGKPLIAWSIDVARNIDEICDIFVSTDDQEIKDVALQYNAFVPILRPKELSTDTALSVDVALHVVDWYERNKNIVDGIMILQPTSPFRKKETIKRGIKLFEDSGRNSILGVSLTHSHPSWCFTIEKDYIKPFLKDNEEGYKKRSQDLDQVYIVNGSFYLLSVEALKREKAFITSKTRPLIVESRFESLDIDTEEDWKYAEYIVGETN